MDQDTYRLETLRGELVAVANRQQDLLHHDVLLLSQSLDLLIVKAQTKKRKLLEEAKATRG
ncbi:Spo0E family sporulation regulatory protein-aspartic acid phosphatase [Paenibacillus phyllosphaerae]|uniref:Spo0E family sporulation regulatory protein-aspartic acid phosphatase n=1 Tax=Paenibacillus phyllosphaerae TaxID=274593 RepID=UPI001FE4877A|nr:Spo0E family sporulation regulatory protein-aspartic acid phosphatase [Paenibacillus phyllosphaerae]